MSIWKDSFGEQNSLVTAVSHCVEECMKNKSSGFILLLLMEEHLSQLNVKHEWLKFQLPFDINKGTNAKLTL